jgi:hypothetical protein
LVDRLALWNEFKVSNALDIEESDEHCPENIAEMSFECSHIFTQYLMLMCRFENR